MSYLSEMSGWEILGCLMNATTDIALKFEIFKYREDHYLRPEAKSVKAQKAGKE